VPNTLVNVRFKTTYWSNIIQTFLICLRNLFCNVGWLWKTSGWLLPNVHSTPFNLSCLTKSIGYWNCAIGRLKLRFWNSEHLITDVSNDACAKGRTQTVWNTGTDQVQPKWFHLQQGDYMNTMRNFYKSTFSVCRILLNSPVYAVSATTFSMLVHITKTYMSVQYHPGILCAGAPARNHGGSSPRCPNSTGATACFCYTNYTSKVVSSFIYELKLVFTKAKKVFLNNWQSVRLFNNAFSIHATNRNVPITAEISV
jgi:hypothetical protein